tara:strand:+ start:51 stop:680 length:630 start_codon:yes stop_codon:yes gene_type:complete
MKQFFKKSLIFLFTISLVSSSCSLRKNNVEEKNELPKPEIINNSNLPETKYESQKPEIINNSKTPKNSEVSARGKVLCFERAKQEKNEFLSETAYENCLLTIDKNLEEFDEKQADLYFLEKKENNNLSKPSNKFKKDKKKQKKKKKKKKNNPKVVNTNKKENSCKEGSIAGGVLGAGIGLATAKGKNKFWAVPAGGAAGALIGCQIDGG